MTSSSSTRWAAWTFRASDRVQGIQTAQGPNEVQCDLPATDMAVLDRWAPQEAHHSNTQTSGEALLLAPRTATTPMPAMDHRDGA